VIYMKGKGIVLNEPSVVATDASHRTILAVGDEAKKMIGKTPGSICAINPLKGGVIADYDVGADMLCEFLKKIRAIGIISRPDVIISTPYTVTEVERRAVESAVYDTGVKTVDLVSEPMAAAVGSGLDVTGSRGAMIVDVGGGTTEVAVISLGGIVTSSSTVAAGNMMDDSIIRYLKQEHHILIGDSTAEMLKKTIGSAHPSTDRGETEIRGLNRRSGLPATMSINSSQIRLAMSDCINEIVRVIRLALESTPPELSADIFDYGILLTGGGAYLAGLQQTISEKAGVRVTVAKRPLESVAMGIGKIMERGMTELVDVRPR